MKASYDPVPAPAVAPGSIRFVDGLGGVQRLTLERAETLAAELAQAIAEAKADGGGRRHRCVSVSGAGKRCMLYRGHEDETALHQTDGGFKWRPLPLVPAPSEP